jgi:hypothetical protein
MINEVLVIGKYPIRRAFWHKEYVFLLSVVSTLTGTSAMWSTHKHEGQQMPLIELAILYQTSHDKQMDELILKEYLNEPAEYKDATQESIIEEQLSKLRNE